MSQAGFEPTIPASKRPQIHALDSAATGIGSVPVLKLKNTKIQIYGIYRNSLRVVLDVLRVAVT